MASNRKGAAELLSKKTPLKFFTIFSAESFLILQQDNFFPELDSSVVYNPQKMAISSYPTSADYGVLCIILANTAISISIMKDFVLWLLHVIGIHISSWDGFSVEPSYSSDCRLSPSESYMAEFWSRTPSMQYDSVFTYDCHKNQECSICLSKFHRTAEINRLSCGHVFHKSCLEKWLNYWNMTCPLCRNYLMCQEEVEEEDVCPM